VGCTAWVGLVVVVVVVEGSLVVEAEPLQVLGRWERLLEVFLGHQSRTERLGS
jgi:hypothetical protein